MTTVVARLAAWVVDLRYEALPEAVLQRARQCILDQLGIQLRGATLPQVQPVLDVVAAMGGTPEATVVARGLKTSAPYAAYVNGTFGHSCEFDDSHFHCGHPGVCVIPAALAMAERQRAGGRALLEAVVAGYQAQTAGVGPVHRGTLTLGWHGTKIGGVFGAAAASAKLLGLNAAQTAHALAVSASEASGTMEYDQSGGEVKRLHAGAASRSGVQAALLAARGMTGPAEIFEGRRGIYRLFGDGSAPQIERYWNGQFHILDTMFKLYPAAGTVHAPLDALTAIQAQLDFAPADIEAIDVGIAEWAIPHGAAITRPTDCISAQFSLAFSLALRVVRKSNDLQLYLDPALWSDPVILSVADRVRTHPIRFEPGAPELGATVEVVLKDGRRSEQHQRAPRGFPENPASDEDLRLKFRSLVDGLIPPQRARQIMRTVDALEELQDVSELCALLTI